MKMADFNRLKKFMAMTTSPNDAEALVAVRRANALIESEGLTWTRVLDRSVKVINEIEAAPESYGEETSVAGKDPDLDVAFLAIDEMRDGTFKRTLEDIHRQYLEKGWVSPAQRALVLRGEDQARTSGRR